MMEKELVNKIMEKRFIELSTAEREELKDWCSTEEEYDQLTHVFSAVEKMKADQLVQPKPETKRSLDDLFAQKHAKPAPVFWYNSVMVVLYPTDKSFARRPLVQIAAVGLIVLLTVPFLSKNQLNNDEPQIAKVEQTKPSVPQSKSVETITPEEVNMTESTTIPSVSVVEDKIDVITHIETIEPFTATVETATVSFGSARAEAALAFDHPDGIFTGESSVAYSQPASSQPAMLDLLTASF